MKGIETYHLDNGLQVILQNIPHRSSASMGIWVPMGSRLEGDNEQGYCHFTEHMLFKGTEKRTYKDLAREIDRLGGYINASTSREITNYYITISSKFMGIGLDVLADMYFASTFADEEFNTEKRVILEEIKMGEDNPDEYLFDLFYLDAYGDTPIGRPIAGTVDSISASSRDGLREFYQGKYGPRGCVLSLGGNLWEDEAGKKKLLAEINQHFERKSELRGEPGFKGIVEQTSLNDGVIRHYRKSLEQVHFAIGLPGLSEVEEEQAFMHVFSHLMGGTMSSRLFRLLREEHGLCYSVGTFHARYAHEGLWGVYCGTSKESFLKAVDLTLEEMTKVLRDKVPEHEITESISGLAGSMELSMESAFRHASFNAKSVLYHGGLRDWRDEVTAIEKTSAAQVWDGLEKLWKGAQFTLTSLGDLEPEEIESYIKGQQSTLVA